jgi:hypothetical protein
MSVLSFGETLDTMHTVVLDHIEKAVKSDHIEQAVKSDNTAPSSPGI